MVAVVGQTGRRQCERFVDRAALTSSGLVLGEPVIAGVKRPLHLTLLTLTRDASLSWRSPDQDQLVFVWGGSVSIGARSLTAGDVVVVEHGASADLQADPEAQLMLFERPAGSVPAPARIGGQCHIMRAADLAWGSHDIMSGTSHALFLASDCPTCDLWLHASDFPGKHQGSVHWHTDDEIIVVTAGTIVLGNARMGRGAALAVDANTVYSFAAGDEGLTFVNFRPGHSLYVRKDSDAPPMEERDYMLEALANNPVSPIDLMGGAGRS